MYFSNTIDLRFKGGADAAALFEYSLNVLVYDSASPLHRCMAAEFDYSVLPRPKILSDGIVQVTGIISSDLFQCLLYHPDSKRVKGILKAELSASKFLLYLENSFIAYLSCCKTNKLRLPKSF